MRLCFAIKTQPNFPYPSFLSNTKSSICIPLLEAIIDVFLFRLDMVEKLLIVCSSLFFSADLAFYISGDELNLLSTLALSILGVRKFSSSFLFLFVN